MKTKLILAAVALATLALTGCGSAPTRRMDNVDLQFYKVDCQHMDEQIAFLKTQIPTSNQVTMNRLRMTSLFGVITSIVDGTYEEERASFSREQTAAAEDLIGSIHRNCRPNLDKVKAKPKQGCITLNESMSAGASTGTQCWVKTQKQPTVTRWEALVDE